MVVVMVMVAAMAPVVIVTVVVVKEGTRLCRGKPTKGLSEDKGEGEKLTLGKESLTDYWK